jgi:small-conductance mechanosensitive channel
MATDPTQRILEAHRAAMESVSGGVLDFLRTPIIEIGQTAVSPLRILITALVLALLWWIGRHGGRRLLHRVIDRRQADEKSRYALKRLADIALTIIGIWLGLEVLGVGLGGVMTILAALGVGIGFGLQGFVKDLLSGLIMLIDAPIRQGDLVEIGAQAGVVRAIGWRSTTILNWDNVEVLVPNHQILEHELINWTLTESLSRIVIPFGVAYNSDVRAVVAAALAVAKAQPDVVASPEPIVQLMDFGDSALLFRVAVWTREPWNRVIIASQLRMDLVEHFRRAGIEIPFPQRDLHLVSGWPRAGQEES